MNPRLPALKYRQVFRALQRAGFELDHASGSHHVLRHPDGRRVTLPYHSGRDIKRGLLRAIIAQSGLSVDHFLKLL